jgi:hypothetical protein
MAGENRHLDDTSLIMFVYDQYQRCVMGNIDEFFCTSSTYYTLIYKLVGFCNLFEVDGVIRKVIPHKCIFNLLDTVKASYSLGFPEHTDTCSILRSRSSIVQRV